MADIEEEGAMDDILTKCSMASSILPSLLDIPACLYIDNASLSVNFCFIFLPKRPVANTEK